MSFEVIGHDKNGFVVKRSRAKLMVCEFRVPHEGRNFAKCKLTPAGEKLLRDKPKKER